MFGFLKKDNAKKDTVADNKFQFIVPSQSSREKTEEWYNKEWTTIQAWVTELASSKTVDSIYIENFLDAIPQGVDKKYLCDIFNEDGGYWRMTLDAEKSLVIFRK